MNGNQIIKKLKSEGWILDRIQGSHHVFIKPGHLRCVTVPVHGSTDLGIGLIKAIEKQSGVKLK